MIESDPRPFLFLTTGHNNLDIGVVDNVLDSVRSKGIVQGHRDQVVANNVKKNNCQYIISDLLLVERSRRGSFSLDTCCKCRLTNGGRTLRVTTHLSDEPLGATMGPNTKRPSVELLVSENDLVQVHDTASESIDALVDLAVSLPSVSSISLSDSVERAVSQEVIVAVLGNSCEGIPWITKYGWVNIQAPGEFFGEIFPRSPIGPLGFRCN